MVSTPIQPNDREDSATCNLHCSVIRHCWPVPSTDPARDTNATGRKRRAKASVRAGREASGRQCRGAIQSSGPGAGQSGV